MIENKERTISGKSYVVTQFPARRALKLKTRLIKLVAPSLFSVLGNSGTNIMETKVDSSMIKSAVSILADKLDADEVEDLVISLFASTRRDGKELNAAEFDRAYAGNFGEMYGALQFVLEVNFGSFLDQFRTGNQGEVQAENHLA